MFLQEAIDDYAGYARTELGHASTTVLTYRARQQHFAWWLAENGTPEPKIEDVTAGRAELRGKVLGCWCKPKACHGDVLVELIEGEPE